MNHYEVLGVGRDATAAQIRSAFRRLARAHHPDTSTSGSADALAPINDAWRVLGDPALRREYDRSLAAGQSSPVDDNRSQTPGPPPEPLPPSNFPWRFLAGLAIVLIGIVWYADSRGGSGGQTPPDNVLEVGSCVVIQDNGDAAEVNCADNHDGVVENRIGDGELCATPMEPHRDQQGLGVVCVRFDV